MKVDIILCGVGGQGILSIATIIGEAAMNENLYIKQAEVHGMSQRGGDVQSNLRISSNPIASDLTSRSSRLTCRNCPMSSCSTSKGKQRMLVCPAQPTSSCWVLPRRRWALSTRSWRMPSAVCLGVRATLSSRPTSRHWQSVARRRNKW